MTMMDIVDRLRFDAVRCELQFSKGVAENINDAADEIERLRAAQPQPLAGCLHPGNEPLSCQYEGGCQSEACDHWNKTEYRARMTVLAQVDGILYPKQESSK